MSRAYTEEEVLNEFMDQLRSIAKYWAKVEDRTELEKIQGAIFSVLSSIEGVGYPFISMDLILRPHPEDKDYHIENGDNYYENGMVINDSVHLHNMFYKEE